MSETLLEFRFLAALLLAIVFWLGRKVLERRRKRKDGEGMDDDAHWI